MSDDARGARTCPPAHGSAGPRPDGGPGHGPRNAPAGPGRRGTPRGPSATPRPSAPRPRAQPHATRALMLVLLFLSSSCRTAPGGIRLLRSRGRLPVGGTAAGGDRGRGRPAACGQLRRAAPRMWPRQVRAHVYVLPPPTTGPRPCRDVRPGRRPRVCGWPAWTWRCAATSPSTTSSTPPRPARGRGSTASRRARVRFDRDMAALGVRGPQEPGRAARRAGRRAGRRTARGRGRVRTQHRSGVRTARPGRGAAGASSAKSSRVPGGAGRSARQQPGPGQPYIAREGRAAGWHVRSDGATFGPALDLHVGDACVTRTTPTWPRPCHGARCPGLDARRPCRWAGRRCAKSGGDLGCRRAYPAAVPGVLIDRPWARPLGFEPAGLDRAAARWSGCTRPRPAGPSAPPRRPRRLSANLGRPRPSRRDGRRGGGPAGALGC